MGKAETSRGSAGSSQLATRGKPSMTWGVCQSPEMGRLVTFMLDSCFPERVQLINTIRRGDYGYERQEITATGRSEIRPPPMEGLVSCREAL